MFVLGQKLRPKPWFHVRCRWRGQSGAAAFPRHEQQAKVAISRGCLRRRRAASLCRHVRFVFAPILIRSLLRVMYDIVQGGQDCNNPRSSSLCSACTAANTFPLVKTICIIGHAVQVYSSIQLWIIHIHPRVSNAYFAAAAASRITRSTLSGMVAYLALSSRAWPHESASLTLKSVLGRMRSSPSEGTMLSAWMSLAL